MKNIYGRKKVRKREKSNKKIGEKNKGKRRRKQKKQDP